MIWEGALYFLRTYWIFMLLALMIGLLAGWFSHSQTDDTESEPEV